MSGLASQCIDDLDSALAAAGEDIILRRKTGAGSAINNIDVGCRAAVTTTSVQEIAAGIPQTDLNIIISPTQINNAQWPGGQAPGLAVPFDTDARLPLIGRDNIIVQKRLRTVAFVDPKYVDGTLVRINMRVTG